MVNRTVTTETTSTEEGEVLNNNRGPVRRGAAPWAVSLARLIWLVAAIIILLLIFRFFFVLLGANPSNGFVNFIYTASHPFAAPFFGVFGYHQLYGFHRFEPASLVAIAVYAIITFLLTRLVMIRRTATNV